MRYDSAAGALIACGLLEIAEHVPQAEKGLYHAAAVSILRACEARFADWNPETDGILQQGATMVHEDRLGDQSFIYGDYFFLEGVLRLKGKALRIW